MNSQLVLGLSPYFLRIWVLQESNTAVQNSESELVENFQVFKVWENVIPESTFGLIYLSAEDVRLVS